MLDLTAKALLLVGGYLVVTAGWKGLTGSVFLAIGYCLLHNPELREKVQNIVTTFFHSSKN